MRIATFQYQGRRHVGQVAADGSTVTPFQLDAEAASRGAQPLVEAAAAGQAWPDLADTALPLSAVKLEAPLPQPRRNLWCVGRNYHAHATELKDSVFKDSPKATDQWPIVFTKVPESVTGPDHAVQLPGEAISTQIDYEAELTIVIGRGGRNISRAQAMDHIFGWTIINDVTARDVQIRHNQWDLGKSFDTFCPMGPWIVTADEFDGRDTRVRCWVNDELRQDARTTDLIFDIPTLIETVSRGITLLPGDIIATGSPAGVGMGMNPPRWLASGDVVRIEIDGLGTLVNRFE
ncbi:fumarylacetoacetate hydrolase family protein [Piscinibacter sakaiensis]|uniref:fumarylacetoacetate hydrolase family protein n=1 Tax=Piscinibacter sakaiensis TaxID=1547922 RepID=UPI003AAE5AD2